MPLFLRFARLFRARRRLDLTLALPSPSALKPQSPSRTMHALTVLAVCVLATASTVAGLSTQTSIARLRPSRFRTQAEVGDLACYGRYCGLASNCADGLPLSPAVRAAPIDRLDGACFLHDLCYTCSQSGSSDSCCPDPQLLGVDRAECDRVFLERLKNDDVCAGPTEGQLSDLSGENTVGCETARLAAITLFEVILAGRQFGDLLTGDGLPSATTNRNGTCPAFSCPYTEGNDCFRPCGDDGCGGQCASECPSGQTCHPYAHACFLTPAGADADPDPQQPANPTPDPQQPSNPEQPANPNPDAGAPNAASRLSPTAALMVGAAALLVAKLDLV